MSDLIAVIARRPFVNTYVGAKKAGDLFYCVAWQAEYLEAAGYVEIADEELQINDDPGYYPDGEPVKSEK